MGVRRVNIYEQALLKREGQTGIPSGALSRIGRKASAPSHPHPPRYPRFIERKIIAGSVSR